MSLLARARLAGPFAAVVAIGAYALAVDVSLPARLPSSQDWAEAAGAIRAKARPGDGVQVWPPWAERVHAFVDGVPVFTEEHLQTADYAGVERLWLLALAGAPNARTGKAREALLARGAAPGEVERFGALELQPWDLRSPKLAADLTALMSPQPRWFEVAYVPRRCVPIALGPPGGPGVLRANGESGSTLHVRAGLIGEAAYKGGAPAQVDVRVNGAQVATLAIPPAVDPQVAWYRADVQLAAGEARREFTFALSSAQPGRTACVQAWTTR